MKNVDIINIINGINSNSGIMQKRLPVRVLFTLKRNISALNMAIGVYRETLDTICGQHGISSEQIGAEAMPDGLAEEISDLLNEEADVSIVWVPEDVLSVDSDRYDALTFAELSALEFMIGGGAQND